MDKDTLLKSLTGTLDSNFQVRKHSEQQLRVFEEQPGFSSYLLDLITDQDVQLGIQISAAIFFKNRVSNHWLAPDNRPPSALTVRAEEKPLIKEKLIQTLIQTHRNNQIRLQLSTAMSNIISVDKWDDLIPLSKKLLVGVDNIDHVYTGLICLYEYTKNYRWAGLETANAKNPVLEQITEEIFPNLEQLLTTIIESGAPYGDEMMYLIIKIFKFATFSTLPTYFEDQSNLGKWCHMQLLIINKPLPDEVMQAATTEEKVSHPRIKTVKWCFGNLHRILTRHGGGFGTKNKESNTFAKLFLESFVPEILNAYWSFIEKWSTKKVWLSEASLYHLISFLEQVVDTPAWGLIADKLDAILLHVILPTLSGTEETIELYEDEPDEYIRRFFDINRESNTADIASINFVFRLSAKKFSQTAGPIFSIVNQILIKRQEDKNDLDIAMKTEACLRIISTLSYKLDKKLSPVRGQVDRLIHTFICPELSAEAATKTPWLTARACDTLAMFAYKYKDQQVLEDVYRGVIECFLNDKHLPIQITAVDALRTLVDEESVAEHIAPQAPQLMGTLLEMSKKFESDILTSVMDSFVEKFAKNLEPYAYELASRLVEQFVHMASELLSQQSGNDNKIDIDKEYQASGILNTLTTLVIAMNSSPSVASSMEVVLKDMVKFVLDNAMVTFLGEIIEILESILFSTQQVSDTMWSLFQNCIDSFDTYAFEYFDTFQAFFESIINYGFSNENITMESPYVQSLLNVCFSIFKNELFDPIFGDSAFELIELIILSMNTRFIPFLPRFLPEIFEVFKTLEAEDAFDGHMLHHLSILKIFFGCFYIDPSTTLQFLKENQFTGTFLQLWIKYSDDFQSVYGCKVQILAALRILCDADVTLLPLEDSVHEVVDVLLSDIEALPHAIKARQDILSGEREIKALAQKANQNDDDDDFDEYDNEYFEDDFEAEEAELEAMKQTPIDNINVFEIFANKLTLLQNLDSNKYQLVFGNVDAKQKQLIQNVIQINQQQKQQSI